MSTVPTGGGNCSVATPPPPLKKEEKNYVCTGKVSIFKVVACSNLYWWQSLSPLIKDQLFR